MEFTPTCRLGWKGVDVLRNFLEPFGCCAPLEDVHVMIAIVLWLLLPNE
jgi:hypothetical protein